MSETLPEARDPEVPEIMYKNGGKIWDTLFILLKDNDSDFVLDIIDRLPCEKCKKNALNKISDYNLENKTKEELYEILWKFRGDIHPKYKDKPLKEYLDYLF